MRISTLNRFTHTQKSASTINAYKKISENEVVFKEMWFLVRHWFQYLEIIMKAKISENEWS